MTDWRAKNAEKLKRKFGDVMEEYLSRCNEKSDQVFWNVYVAVNAAGGELGLPREEIPVSTYQQ